MAKMKFNITFDNFTFQKPVISAIIRSCAEAVLREEKVSFPCEINILVTNDQGIRAINNASRNIDKPTDVLSFPMFQLTPGEIPEDWQAYIDPETGLCPLGDMAISLERAIGQAKEFGHSFEREVAFLTVHSMLHLLGYDHETGDEDEAEMREKQRAIMDRLGLTV